MFATRYQPVHRQRFLFPGLGIGDASPGQKLITLIWLGTRWITREACVRMPGFDSEH